MRQLPYTHARMQEGKPNRKKLQGARTRDELLAAAIKVFSERGYHCSTMEDIVAEVGTTRGALYWHFSSKEDFLLSLLTKSQELWNREKAGDFNFTGQAGEIREILTWWAEFSDRIPWFARLFLTMGLDADNISPRIRNIIRQQLATTRRFLALLIKEGQKAGGLRQDLNPNEAAALLVAIRLGLLASWFTDARNFDLGSLTQSFIRVLLPALLSPREASKKIPAGKLSQEDYDEFTRQWLVERGLSTLGFRRNVRRPQTIRPKRATRKRLSYTSAQ
jgi:AcrR family transcriptional regulator